MAKLNQIIAIEKGIKSQTHSEISQLYKLIQKPDLFSGSSRTYQKINDEGEDLPPERKKVQVNAPDVITNVSEILKKLFDITLRKDVTNLKAVADVKIGDVKLLEKVPVTFLLFLEKQLTDLRTFITNLPILDELEDWTKDPNSNLFKTEEIKTHKTKKLPKVLVKYEATEQHPAQTEVYTEDVLVGYWSTVKLSGSVPKPEKESMLERVNEVLDAVKQAREEANGIDETDIAKTSEHIFDYIFG